MNAATDQVKREVEVSAAKVVIVERAAPHVAVVTLNRPQVCNAVNGDLALALQNAVLATESDDTIRAVVLTGAGSRAFCAGADLRELSTQGTASLRTASGGFAGFVRQNRAKPWIAAVNGPALAGGLEIALACDIILAAEHATFGLPEAARGIVASAGGAFRLPRAMPRGLALEMALTGASIDADRALQSGLINRILTLDHLVPAALALAVKIAGNAPLAVRETRNLVLLSYDLAEQDLFRLSDGARERIAATADFKEGPRAFLEKRAPLWEGK